MRLEPWIDRALKLIPEPTRIGFALDPIEALTGALGLKVRPVPSLSEQRDDGGFCDGMSFLKDGVMLYAPSENRRQNFTLAHELGHWIVNRDVGLFDWISDQDDAPVLLETVCDRLAQRLILPDDLTASVVGDGPVRARHVQELFDGSVASYPACSIGIARHVRGMGAVVLIERWTQSVYHASIKPDPDEGWPKIYPWRGQILPDAHALLNIAPGEAMTRRISWRSPWGGEAEFFADAIADDKRVMAIFSDLDLWASEPGRVLAPREYDDRPVGLIFCCGQERMVRGYPCPNCHQQFCPVCKKCQCDRDAQAEVQCSGCFLLKRPNLLVNGLCEDCR
jgi:hypothetical protein